MEVTCWNVHTQKRLIRDSIPKRHIYRVSFAFAYAFVIETPASREKVTKTMQRASHDTVGGVECLLNAIPVMAINVDVENAGIGPEEF